MKYVVFLRQKIGTNVYNTYYLATLNDMKNFELAISNLQVTLFSMGLNPIVEMTGDGQFTRATINY